jgi:hypothetical protein
MHHLWQPAQSCYQLLTGYTSSNEQQSVLIEELHPDVIGWLDYQSIEYTLVLVVGFIHSQGSKKETKHYWQCVLFTDPNDCVQASLTFD